jgi:GNAT superfamily N-acetyltransferase
MCKMIDFSLIKLIPAEERHREFSYQLKKTVYGDYITRIWGWDEAEQREYHTQDWTNNRVQIVLYDGRPVGNIYVSEDEDHIEIGQFYILPEYQNKGIGTYLLEGILERADRLGLPVRLAYLHINPVASLYKRYCFKVVRSDDIFHFTERKPGGII